MKDETIREPGQSCGEECEPQQQSPLRKILDRPATSMAAAHAPAVLTGMITRIDPDGVVEASYAWPEGRRHTHVARHTMALDASAVGRKCVLVFDGDDIARPIVIGLLQAPASNAGPLVIRADSGIVIQAGAARIELGEDGQINIQGMYINSQAYGPHRIKGGSVKIN